MATTVPQLQWRAVDTNGDIAPGARMYWFAAGTETPATVYSDSGLSVAHSQPIDADASGWFPVVYAADGSYKVRVTKSASAGGATLYEADNLTIASGSVATNKFLATTSTKTANYTVTTSDQNSVILVDASGAPGQNVVISANSSTLGNGFPFWVINTGSVGTVTIQGSGGQTIDGAASFTLSTQNAGIGLTSLGAGGWRIFTNTGGIFNTAVTFNAAATFSSSATFNSSITYGTSAYFVGGPFIQPMGRLTLVTATPVITSDQTGKTTVYFTPFNGNRISIPNGSGWMTNTFSEVSQALTDTTKSPAAATTNSVYDLFAWDDSGTLRVTRGPLWSTSTTRGTGAGTTELDLLNGIYVNKVAITNGPAASRGVYVGTIATDGSTQMSVMFRPTAAAGGTANRIDLWNTYNRLLYRSVVRDSTDTWSYTTATWRSANNSTSNRVTFVRGLDQSAMEALACGIASNGTGAVVRAGIGLDSTSAFSDFPAPLRISNAAFGNMIGPARYGGLPGIGSHFLQWLEHSDAAGTTNWYGDNGTATEQAGLLVSGCY